MSSVPGPGMSAMRRSSSSRTGRRSVWRRTASATVPTTVQAEPAAAGRRTGRLSEGTLVEASIVGRMLGVRILRIDAVVLLSPAVPPPVSVASAPSPRPRPGRLPCALRSIDVGAGLPALARRLTQGGRLPGPPPPAGALGRIDEGAELLAEARRLRQGGGLAAPPTAAGRRPGASAAGAVRGRS